MNDGNGVFPTLPRVIIQFPEVHTSLIQGLYINWGEGYDEYATSFTIDVFNGDTLIATKDVTDNKDVKTSVFMDIQNFNAIRITINKWCLPNHRARLQTFVPGTKIIFDKNDLMSFTHTQEADPISSSLARSSITFSLDNTKNTYNPFNDEGKSKYFSANQEIKVRYGYNIDGAVEWIKGGTYYLSDWDAKQNGNSAEFTAIDLLDLMTDTFDHEGYEAEEVSLYDLAEKALTYSTLPQWIRDKLKWRIDESLRNITTTGTPHGYTCAEALQYIANAACCMLYVDRDGVICIEPVTFDDATSNDYSVSPENSYSKPETKSDKEIKQLIVREYAHTLVDDDGDEVFDVDEVIAHERSVIARFPTLHPGAVTRVDFPNDGRWVLMNGRNTTGNEVFSAIIAYPTYCLIFSRTDTDKKYMNLGYLTGFEILTSETQRIIVVSPTGEELTIENPLITSEERALTVGEWMKSYLTKLNTQTLSWRADPRLDVLDVIRSKDEFTDSNLILTKVEYVYNGAFKGVAEGRVM
jgi:hypothetical protein